MCVCASQQAAGACGLVVCDSWLGAYDVRDEGSAPNGWAPLLYRGVVRGRREPYHQTERHEGLVFSVYRDNVLCSGERESLVNTISDYGVTMGFGLRNCTVLGAKLRHAKPEPHVLLDGVLRNFDLGKVPLCLFVRSKLGRASYVQCGES